VTLEEVPMAECHTCGNDYDKTFDVTIEGETFTFDSFECAIQALAPTCGHCECRILGHGVEDRGAMYCCAHCARAEGSSHVRDRAEAPIDLEDVPSVP
jgi:hypothetical protein